MKDIAENSEKQPAPYLFRAIFGKLRGGISKSA